MKRNEIWPKFEVAYKKSKHDHPHWPDHAAGQAGMVTEASGKLMSACLDWKYDKNASEMIQEVQQQRIEESAIDAAVKAIRFLENLK